MEIQPEAHIEALMPEDAVSRFLSELSPVSETEVLPLLSAIGRYCAEDYAAKYSQPPFDRSPLDGYAICATDLDTEKCGELPLVLSVTECLFAGDGRKLRLSPGSAVRIMTGAPIPEGADTVVRQEDTDGGEGKRNPDGSYTPGRVRIFRCPKSGMNYVRQGEDYRNGAVLIHKGDWLGAQQIALLASMGYAEVSVLRKIRVSVFSTGNELTAPGSKLTPGKIYDLNSFAVAAYVSECGEATDTVRMVADEADQVASEIGKAFLHADLVITTGGVSVGKKDIMPEVLELLSARTLFQRLPVKPGMPTRGAICHGKPLLCLSGNPGAAYTHLLLFGQALFLGLHGLASADRFSFPVRRARLVEGIDKTGPSRRLLRAHYENGTASFSSGQYSSGVFSGFSGCNCLIDLPAESEPLCAGAEIKVILTGPEMREHILRKCRASIQERIEAGTGHPVRPVIFAVSGFKNSGKTTLMEQLVERLSEAGVKVACIKHDGHDFVPDVPGTDSDRFRRAGAYGTAVFSARRFMAVKEISGVTEQQLAALFPEAELILLEGFKNSPYPKYVCSYPEEIPDAELVFTKIMKMLGYPDEKS